VKFLFRLLLYIAHDPKGQALCDGGHWPEIFFAISQTFIYRPTLLDRGAAFLKTKSFFNSHKGRGEVTRCTVCPIQIQYKYNHVVESHYLKY
jgi:hypothetical protein